MTRRDEAISDALNSQFSSRLTRRQFMTRTVLVGAGVLAAGGLLAACADGDDEPAPAADPEPADDDEDEPAEPVDDDEEEDEAETPAEPADPTADKVLRVGHHLDPTTLNPADTTTAAFQSVYAQIVEQLVIFASDNVEIQPWLATDWEWVDETTLEMRLREGIEFTNGEPFNADSAKFTIDVFTEAGPYAFLLPREVYESTEVIDEHTIQVSLSRPYAPFLGFLARGGAAFPPEYYTEQGVDGYGLAPIGTGPFMLDEWVRDSHITLVRNEDYWDGPHPISEVIYRVIPEETPRMAALETGEIDIALGVPISALGRLENAEGITVEQMPGLRKFAVHFDTVNMDSPVDDPLVRRALNHAVDKQAIVDSLYQGAADVLQGQWQVEHEFGHNPDVQAFEYDPDLARELLAEAGYGDGFEFQLTWTVGRYPLDREQGEIVTSYIQAIGVQVEPRPLEYGAFTGVRDEGALGSHLWGLLLPPDPHFNFALFTEGTIYEYHHLGAEYTELVEQGSIETDLTAREEIYHQIVEIMHEDPPMLYLIVPRDIYAVSERVQNFIPRADQVLWLFDVDLTD